MENRTKAQIAADKWCNPNEVKTEIDYAGYTGYISGYEQAIRDNILWKPVLPNHTEDIDRGIIGLVKGTTDTVVMGILRDVWNNGKVTLHSGYYQNVIEISHYITVEDLLKLQHESNTPKD